MRITDPREREVASGGLVTLEDAENRCQAIDRHGFRGLSRGHASGMRTLGRRHCNAICVPLESILSASMRAQSVVDPAAALLPDAREAEPAMKMRDPRLALALVVVLAACGDGASPVEDEAPTPAEGARAAAASGNANRPGNRHRVLLRRAAPRLGDALTLTLAVCRRRPDVAVDMPGLRRRLGTFRHRRLPRPARRWTKTVPCDSCNATRCRRRRAVGSAFPQLRIEFVDERAGQTDARPLELLTG